MGFQSGTSPLWGVTWGLSPGSLRLQVYSPARFPPAAAGRREEGGGDAETFVQDQDQDQAPPPTRRVRGPSPGPSPGSAYDLEGGRR